MVTESRARPSQRASILPDQISREDVDARRIVTNLLHAEGGLHFRYSHMVCKCSVGCRPHGE